jgi:hypothetical protein
MILRMKIRLNIYPLIISALIISACAMSSHKGSSMTSVNKMAKGDFTVKLAPQALHDTQADASMARLSIDKQFTGDLMATSKGEMLSAMGSVKGSAGYVAMERVTGTLAGLSGSFALQHTGTMNRGVSSLSVTVVPDSGTDQLQGLSGSMKIIIEQGKHAYEFEYSLPSN